RQREGGDRDAGQGDEEEPEEGADEQREEEEEGEGPVGRGIAFLFFWLACASLGAGFWGGIGCTWRLYGHLGQNLSGQVRFQNRVRMKNFGMMRLEPQSRSVSVKHPVTR